MSKKNKTGNLANLSAKIKHVYIELNRYSFFHNPSNVKMQDTRFIGREKLIERLKIILSHNETRSGAYLITGFRGVGKTTFVNRVISEVTVQ
ncbi:MAG: ATP-binding protein, partial [Gammaproteobacteria bacterium]|nr:ATP-binding protein [Gammaproteobacteria bacterium]